MPKEYTVATSGLLNKKTGYYHAENVRSFGLFVGKGLDSIEVNAKDVLVQVVYKAEAEECAQKVVELEPGWIEYIKKIYPDFEPVEKAMKDAGWSKGDINEVILKR